MLKTNFVGNKLLVFDVEVSKETSLEPNEKLINCAINLAFKIKFDEKNLENHI